MRKNMGRSVKASQTPVFSPVQPQGSMGGRRKRNKKCVRKGK